MRDKLNEPARRDRPDHAGLAYERWAPVDANGKVDETAREDWLDRLEKIPRPKGYEVAYGRWARGHERSVSTISKREGPRRQSDLVP